MTRRNVLSNPDEKLRKSSVELSKEEAVGQETSTLISDLLETMVIENGVGIAAPQIGVLKRVIVIDIGSGPMAYINPIIVKKSFRKTEGEEGCLSVPGIYGMVKRHKEVKVKALTPEGQKISFKATGFLAVVFQHEVDHLDGILFIDKVTRFTTPPML